MKKFSMDPLLNKTNFMDVLSKRMKDQRDSQAIMFKDSVYTFGELESIVDSLASSFLEMGIAKGERIALIFPTRPEFLFCWFAASKIGATTVGLNVRYKEKELSYMINDSQASTLICINNFGGTDYGQLLTPLMRELHSLKRVIFLGETTFKGAIDFNSLLKKPIDNKKLMTLKSKLDDECENFVIYTSGTTGAPKGASLTQKSIMAQVRALVENGEITSSDRIFNILPLNHAGGSTIIALITLTTGATLVLHDVFSPPETLQILVNRKITLMGGVPTIYTLLVNDPTAKNYKYPDLRLVFSGGATLSPDVARKIKETFNCVVVSSYGLSEASGLVTYTRINDSMEKVGSTVGKPGAGIKVQIVDADKKPLRPGDVGEVAIKGDLVFKEYIGKPQETAKILQGGCMYTGDQGFLDDNGYLTLVGRLNDMYISGGYNVYPMEIENLLVSHPDILMACVFETSHEIKGEVGVALIVKRSDSKITEEDARKFVKDQLADYKVPARVIFKDVLPMTPLGKIDKRTLRKQFQEGLL